MAGKQTANGKAPTSAPEKPTKLPILDLDEITEPLFRVKMGGKSYDFNRWDSMGLRARNKLGRISARMGEIERLEDPTDDDSDEYDELIVDGVKWAAGMSEEDARANLAKAGDALTTFFALRLERQSQIVMKMLEATTGETASKLIGANGSPSSNRRTRRAARKSG